MKFLKGKANYGFTMVELLIVIAVLGILAVAVLSAINPIEQINRSKDTGSRSDAEQLIGGIDRFYTAKGYYPWQDSPNDGKAGDANWLNVRDKINDATANKILTNLSGGTGELKDSFVSRITASDYNTLYLFNLGQQGSSSYICFKPTSKTFDDDAVKRCTAGLPSDLTTLNPTICGGAANGYSCLP